MKLNIYQGAKACIFVTMTAVQQWRIDSKCYCFYVMLGKRPHAYVEV